MQINIFNFFVNNTVYELVNEVILKKSNDVNASDAKIKKLFYDVIVNSEKATLGQLLSHLVVHIGKYLFVVSYRVNFKQALIDIQDKIKALAAKKIPKKEPLNQPPRKGSVADLRTIFIEKGPPKIELIRPLREPTVDFTKPDKMTEFNRELEVIIARVEGSVVPQGESKQATQKTSDEEIEEALAIMKRNDEHSSQEFFDFVYNMDEAAVRKMIQELKSSAEKRKLSDIDLLWTMIANCEVKESNFEQFKTCLGYIFNSLSEEQLEAFNVCPKFLIAITLKLKARAIAEVINKKQLKLLASNLHTADLLSDILKFIPIDPFFLGKIAAVLPHSTEPLRSTLITILRSFPPPSKKERRTFIDLMLNFESLLDYYIKINEASKAEIMAKLAPKRAPSRRFDSPDVRYKKFHGNQTPFVESKWSEVELTEFVTELKAIHVDNSINYLKNKFDAMDRISLIKFVECSMGDNAENLDKLWKVDKYYPGERDQIEGRNKRLEIVFRNLTDEQLQRASANADFLKLLSNTTDGIDVIAAEIFSADQLGLIASPTQDLNPIIHRQKHEALVYVLKKIPKENLEQKIRAILPFISPKLAEELKVLIEFRAIEFRKGVKEELLSLVDLKVTPIVEKSTEIK